MPELNPPANDPGATVVRQWGAATLFAALAITGIDAVLLQLRKAFFTGGFLTVTYTRSLLEASAFIATSLLTDAAVAGVLALMALWLTARTRLTPASRFVTALLAASLPLVLADVANYRLLDYLGDSFDLGLMFDLTGRHPSEIFAVASTQLVGPALIGLATVLAALSAVAVANRYGSRGQARLAPRLFGWVAALVALALCLGTSARIVSDTFDEGLQRKPSARVLGVIAKNLTDVDFDGYGLGAGLRDPDPFKASVYPYAEDTPGDGIDQDGVGGDLPAGLPSYEERRNPPGPWIIRPNVVLIVLESFRADAVGRTENDKPVTPTLDALRARGVSASQAFSHNGYTAQSRFHIFSGSLADVRQHRTLIDDFKAQGYQVAYFSAQDDSFGGPEFDVGFERADVFYDARQDRRRRYSDFSTAGSLAVPYSVLEERLATFLNGRDPGRPLFLYVNFHDTHFPYHHAGIQPLVSARVLRESEIAPVRADDLHSMYYNTAANVDRAIGDVLAAVEKSLGAPPAVIVTSDHGESLFDEGFLGHGYALNDVQTRIPLIASGLPITIEEPFGQSELRDAIAAAMTRPIDTPPRLAVVPDKTVFQYLGTIDRPRQIGFATGSTRSIYDFRSGRARPAGSDSWVRPSTLEPAAHDAFLRLVQLWERMMLARQRVAQRSGE